jgi:hypothetical protein
MALVTVITSAWIDFDKDGTFDAEEKLGEVSVGAMPGAGSQVFIPDNLMGSNYPAAFSGNPVINQLNVEDGAAMHIPTGVIITIGGR